MKTIYSNHGAQSTSADALTEQRRQSDRRDRETNATHATEANDDSGNFRQIFTIPEAVRLSLMDGIGENTLFNFARMIRAFEMTIDRRIPQAEAGGVFNTWWQTAQADKLLPADASYDEYALLFEDAFHRARVPWGTDTLANAIKRAQSSPLPEAAARFSDPRLQLLVAVCFQLQKLAGDSPFFLSVRDCAEILGMKRLEDAGKMLNGLVLRGILDLVTKGLPGKNRATRFRYAALENGKAVGGTGAEPTPLPATAAPIPPKPLTSPEAGKLSQSEMILRQKELERVEAGMKRIADSYDSHQTWSKPDRTEHKRLKSRREELKKILGLAV